METAYLSLGSNLGDRDANLREAIQRLRGSGEIVIVSSFFETEPVEVVDQPLFLNCAVEIRTKGSAHQLLDEALTIEQEMGRQRTRHKGPRLIDIDILLFGQQVIDEPGLHIPHPAMTERHFVLEPLSEIAPHVAHPVLNRSIRQLRAELAAGAA